jgi:hypothetical protein
MNEQSRILIDEVCLPDMNVHPRAAMMDVSMMLYMAGAERTRDDWQKLVNGVEDVSGRSVLEIEIVQEYSKEAHSSIIVLKLR